MVKSVSPYRTVLVWGSVKIKQNLAKQELLNGISSQYMNQIHNWLAKQKRSFDNEEEGESFEGCFLRILT